MNHTEVPEKVKRAGLVSDFRGIPKSRFTEFLNWGGGGGGGKATMNF